ncbi:hypothetical protein A0J51_02031 [Gluconobacter japonicus]|nr:hypothetical protein A0J51_02031 [Gluconobacter japonicus]
MRTALSGVERLFLLNAVTGDEFTQAILTLNLAREAGVKYVVYLSVLHADRIVNVLHFAVQSGAERMLQQVSFDATVFRASYSKARRHLPNIQSRRSILLVLTR